MEKPRIVLTLSRPVTDASRASHAYYRRALLGAGAEVIEVLPGEEPPRDFDGLVLSGGGDMDPVEYGEPDAGVDRETVDAQRDALERGLADTALASGRPILGICRGFQVLNVVMGGKLGQHVTGHREKDGPIVPHIVRPDPGSLLARACGTTSFSVNSRHHQVVSELADGLRVSATVGDAVEGVEARDGRWILGVQWHPERIGDPDLASGPAARLFAAFVREAARVPAR
jgi:putative glutamine amidotransferase